MTYETIECTRGDGVGTITFDRPDAHNSFDPRMGEAFATATQDLASDDGVRAIVLRANGAAFNSGADLTQLSGDGADEARIRALAADLHEGIEQLVRAPKPVVVGVNGVAAGGGLGTAICGDIVIAAESARFEFAYPRIGFCGDGGSTYLLPRLVGLRRTQELVFRDEPIGAAEAEEIGLVTDVVEDDALEDRVAEEVTRLADGPTRAYGAAKRLLAESFESSLAGQLAAEAEAISELTRTADFERGIAAFGDDEPPEFLGE